MIFSAVRHWHDAVARCDKRHFQPDYAAIIIIIIIWRSGHLTSIIQWANELGEECDSDLPDLLIRVLRRRLKKAANERKKLWSAAHTSLHFFLDSRKHWQHTAAASRASAKAKLPYWQLFMGDIWVPSENGNKLKPFSKNTQKIGKK